MKKEKSCGAIIYRHEKGELKILVLEMNMGHCSNCKGHVENDETEIETAIREIKEETSLDVVIDTKFREVISYSPFPGTIKDVVFFVAEAKTTEIRCQKEEVRCAMWLSPEQAISKMTFPSDKEVVSKAIAYLKLK